MAVTVAVVIALFVVYQLSVARWSAADDQRRFSAGLQQDWDGSPMAPRAAPVPAPTVAIGDPFAVLRIPALGADWEFTVVEGTGQDELAGGPGHYVGTAFPG